MPNKKRLVICKGCQFEFITQRWKPIFCSHGCASKYYHSDPSSPLGIVSEKTRAVISRKLREGLKNGTIQSQVHALHTVEAKAKNLILLKARAGTKNPKVSQYLRDNPPRGHWWHLRSPTGQIYIFNHLKKFIIQNPDLFKSYTENQARKGLNKLYQSKGKWQIAGQWRGWTRFSNEEFSHNESRDLLERRTRIEVELR